MFRPISYMQYALTLAKQGLGRVFPNPAVGCVIVKDGVVVGAGRTADGGRPHAEFVALNMAGRNAQGAIAFVTLEPCAHVGETPSCANLLVESGIQQCYIATTDPDSRTSGKGIKILEDAGIVVHVGLKKEQADIVNKGFFTKVTKNRAMFCAKIAMSVDGKVSLSNGKSKWITGSSARGYGHYMRSTYDAILVGAGTIRADDPKLDCRLSGCENHSPIRIVLGENIPDTAKVLTDGGQTYILNGDAVDIAYKLAEMGITRVLIEGGAKTITTFLRAGLLDEITIFSAPKIMGGDSYDAIGDLSLLDMKNVPQYTRRETKYLGKDIYTLLTKD